MRKITGHYTYEDIEIGLCESFSVEITPQLTETFKNITGDKNPLHVDAAYAQTCGFQQTVVHGMLTASFLSTLAGMYLPGERSLIHSIEIFFSAPVFVGDQLMIRGVVAHKEDLFKTIKLKVCIQNQNGKNVCRGSMQIGVRE